MASAATAPTELRIILAIGTLTLLVHPTATIAGHRYLLFDAGGGVALVGLGVTFMLSAITNTRALAKADPRPPAPAVERDAREDRVRALRRRE